MMYTKGRTLNPVFLNLSEWDRSVIRPLLSRKQMRGVRAQVHWKVGGEGGRWSVLLRVKWTPCIATFRVYWQKKYNKRGGWRCGLPRLVSTFLADNKACLCLDEPLWALSFHNPRPLSLCFADPLCQWIKMWAEGMDWPFSAIALKADRQTRGYSESRKPTPDCSLSLTRDKCVSKTTCVKTDCVKNHLFTCQSATLCYGAFAISQHSS